MRRRDGGSSLREPTMLTRQVFAVCAAALAIAGGARAQTVHETDTDTMRQVKVEYADLDIGHSQGAQALVERIKQASQLACGEAPELANLEQRAAYRSCVVSTEDKAVASVDAPLVTAAYQDKVRPLQV